MLADGRLADAELEGRGRHRAGTDVRPQDIELAPVRRRGGWKPRRPSGSVGEACPFRLGREWRAEVLGRCTDEAVAQLEDTDVLHGPRFRVSERHHHDPRVAAAHDPGLALRRRDVALDRERAVEHFSHPGTVPPTGAMTS